jgi:hypothetical protein
MIFGKRRTFTWNHISPPATCGTLMLWQTSEEVPVRELRYYVLHRRSPLDLDSHRLLEATTPSAAEESGNPDSDKDRNFETEIARTNPTPGTRASPSQDRSLSEFEHER